MNTDNEPNKPDDVVGLDFDKITSNPKNPTNSMIAELERELETERDSRKEERFGWVVCVVVLFDILFLANASNPVTPIGIFILQLIALLIFAKKSGVDYIVVMLDKLIGSLTKRMGDE